MVLRRVVSGRLFGPIDIGVAVTGLAGGVSHWLYQQGGYGGVFVDKEYRCSKRFSALDLEGEKLLFVANDLLRRFFEGLNGGRYKPFKMENFLSTGREPLKQSAALGGGPQGSFFSSSSR